MRLSIRSVALVATLMATPPARATAQDAFVGVWQGTLVTGIQNLRLALEVRRDSAGALRGALTSIDQQGARAVAGITLRGDTLVANVPQINANYIAVLAAGRDSLRGAFTQNGSALPLQMGRVASVVVAPPPARPQTPKGPFPYRAEELTFESVPNVKLAGTLVVPSGAGPFPAVVFVSGSGPQDRDETLVGHKPFLVIADHLARQGIASLRYDDRGVARSTGDFARATSADFADDAEAAVKYLRTRSEIAGDRVGIIGHSEGGLIAPIVAARTRDVAFIVLLAGPGIPGDSILTLQNALIQRAMGVPAPQIDSAVSLNARLFAAVKGGRDSADAAARLAEAERQFVATLPGDKQPAMRVALARTSPQLLGPWMRYFLRYDPRPTLRKVRAPVLALNGTLDLQVPYQANLAAIDTALTAAGNKDYTTTAVPNLNHLFQTARTGAPSEYQLIEETFAPPALDAVSSWITKRFVRR